MEKTIYKFKYQKKLELIIIILLLLVFTGCGKSDTTNNEKIFNRYYYLGSNICSFNGTLSIKNPESKKLITFKISYNNGIGCKIIKYINNKQNSIYILNNDKINYTENINTGETVVYNDTEEIRFKLGIPVNIGIDPYYFLETDMTHSKIKYQDKNTIIINYEKDQLKLKASISINSDKIEKITMSSNGIEIFHVLYSNYRDLGSNIAFPEKYTQVFIKNGKEFSRIESEYTIENINLCN